MTCFIIAIIFTLISIYNVLKDEKTVFLDAFFNLSLFCIMNSSLIFVFYFGHPESYIMKYSILPLYLYGTLFSKLTGHIQICNLGKFQLNQIRKSIIFLCITLPINVLLLKYKMITLHLHNKISLFLLMCGFIVYSHFFIKTTGELCRILNINRFTIKNDNRK